jgi:hypothetical protein
MMSREDLDTMRALDDWLEDHESGVIPADVLKERGVALPPAEELSDDELHDSLWNLIRAMAGIGMFLQSTDHLSDRQLYEQLTKECLLERTFLAPDNVLFGEHIDIIGGFSNDDIRIYLTYYANEEERESFREGFEGDFPKSLPPPYDRDRLLPTQEERAFEGGAPDA